MARWLHGFYSTHAAPYDYGVETLKHLCGSAPKGRLTDFRKALKVALDLMVEKGSLVSADLHPSRDVVQVVRIPSESQKRHLARRAAQSEAAQIAMNESDFNNPNFKPD
ncbi:hypothetical protein ACHMW6_00020 (plasmid) [Pseudoduganella sp. UC29_106]|uniref:hypothetical protein n=1 Tax=Pseudoduganella sp. UC29_106 TaxID=3374553 RepID=UPI0037567A0C